MAQIDVDNLEAVKVVEGGEMSGSTAQIRVIGDDVYLGGSDVTSADGLLLTEDDGIMPLPLDSGDAVFAICLETTGTNEEQTITLTDVSGGTFPLTFDGETTGDIDFDAPAADVKSALVALPNIAASDINVTGEDGGPWTVEFTGATDVPELEIDGADLTGGEAAAAEVETTTPAVAPASKSAVVHSLAN